MAPRRKLGEDQESKLCQGSIEAPRTLGKRDRHLLFVAYRVSVHRQACAMQLLVRNLRGTTTVVSTSASDTVADLKCKLQVRCGGRLWYSRAVAPWRPCPANSPPHLISART